MLSAEREHPAVLTLDRMSLAREHAVVVDGISGAFAPGTMTAVIGPNGAGKSTLLAALAGELQPVSGRLLRANDVRVAYLPQTCTLDRSFPLRVLDVVLLGLWPAMGAWRRLSRAHRDKAAEALAEVGLTDMADRPLHALSNGQFQRLLFARLLVQDASLILLDEPFAAMDERTTQDLLDLLGRWHAQGRTIVTVVHDLAQVQAYFPHTLLMARHLVAWGPTGEVLTPVHLSHAGYLSPAMLEAREALPA